MRISNLRIKNYKCFLDTGDIDAGPGFNIFVGCNDAGKSALIEALTLTQSAKPHRSLTTLPTIDSPQDAVSTTQITYDLSPDDLRAFLSRHHQLYIPLKPEGHDPTIARFNAAVQQSGRFMATWASNFRALGHLLSMGEQDGNSYINSVNAGAPSLIRITGQGHIINGDFGDYGHIVASALKARIYAFRAERMNVGECAVAGNPALAPNAANLPDVLNQLISTNPVRYERLMGHMRTIFPHITQITAPIFGSSNARILVWNFPIDSERADLAVPLSESGTGIGQVLAMLYVVVTSDLPTVVVIDEPQSFLHPGAVRKLMEILRAYQQHQYVITTHAPLALPTSSTDRLFLIRRADYVSTVTSISENSQDDMRTFLAEVGARLSDVFGADSILWVEGKTEETCFPELIRHLAGKPLRGVQILGVISTDELGAKFANRVYDIYLRLSGGTSLLPPAIAFVFDREGRSEIERTDIDRKSGGLVKWLPRRMYENYLLEPAAICTVLNEEDANRLALVTADEISTWLNRKKTERGYFALSHDLPTSENASWQEHVHGAKLLHDLFDEITEQRVEYDKVKHGLRITQFLIKHPTDEVKNLAEMLSDIVSANHH